MDFDFDPSSILGMSSVLNKNETSTGINLKAIEKGFMSNDEETESLLDYDPISEYTELAAGALPEATMPAEYEEPDYSIPVTHYEKKLTEEQSNQNIINSVFSNDAPVETYDFDEESKEDTKLRLLERIDNLKEELEEDAVDISRIPSVGFHSSLQDIENASKLLMLKANRNKYSNMGEDFILALSNGLEILCNGEREFFGMKLDLTHCTDIVKVKLRRVKNETSQIMSDIVDKYEIPPMMTIMLELVPALFLHSQRRSRQRAITNVSLSDDIDEIRKYT